MAKPHGGAHGVYARDGRAMRPRRYLIIWVLEMVLTWVLEMGGSAASRHVSDPTANSKSANEAIVMIRNDCPNPQRGEL